MERSSLYKDGADETRKTKTRHACSHDENLKSVRLDTGFQVFSRC